MQRQTRQRVRTRRSSWRQGYTLLELVCAVQDVAPTDDEVVATVGALVNSGRVYLTGSFRGTGIIPTH